MSCSTVIQLTTTPFPVALLCRYDVSYGLELKIFHIGNGVVAYGQRSHVHFLPDRLDENLDLVLNNSLEFLCKRMGTV